MISNQNLYNEAAKICAESKKVFVFSGAGASRESGLPTFRDLDGDWQKYDPMTFATLDGFLSSPVLVWNLYRMRQKQIKAAQPNPGHIALAQLERHFPNFLLCTQNVDDLHERGGSKNVMHIHGSAKRIKCTNCYEVFEADSYEMPDEFEENTLPKCRKCTSLCRPDIVWFGEMVPMDVLTASTESAMACDLMFIIGTSGEVSGGYGFANYAKANGAKIIEINPTPGALSSYATIRLTEPSGIALPKLYKALEHDLKDLPDGHD